MAFVILSIFALTNAGITSTGGFGEILNPLSFGIIAGLVIWQQLGVDDFPLAVLDKQPIEASFLT